MDPNHQNLLKYTYFPLLNKRMFLIMLMGKLPNYYNNIYIYIYVLPIIE